LIIQLLGRTLRFLYDGSYEEFRKIDRIRRNSYSKYINRTSLQRMQNVTNYLCKEEGAVAAPTAGLHFSKHLLKRLEIKGVKFAEVTLHVGLGTNPVEVEDLSKHKMDSEG
jgi:S-adenosylmethionine:tRNA ribosyltransferase-isomerase